MNNSFKKLIPLKKKRAIYPQLETKSGSCVLCHMVRMGWGSREKEGQETEHWWSGRMLQANRAGPQPGRKMYF